MLSKVQDACRLIVYNYIRGGREGRREGDRERKREGGRKKGKKKGHKGKVGSLCTSLSVQICILSMVTDVQTHKTQYPTLSHLEEVEGKVYKAFAYITQHVTALGRVT